MVIGKIFADATHVYGILACKEEGHRVLFLGGIVHEHQPITIRKSLASFLYADGALGLYPKALRV